MELRVEGEGILGLGVGELAGAGEGGCRKRGESRMVEGERRIEKLDRRWRLRLEEEEGEGGRRRRGKMGRPIRTRTPTRRCAALPRGRPGRSTGLPGRQALRVFFLFSA
jgi:hypothetical protein